MWSGFNLIANRAFWERLPADVQETVNRAVAKHAAQQRAYTEQFNRSLEARLAAERGMAFNRADAASFRKALSADFYRRWQREFGNTAWSLLEAAAGKLS
jgi:TRAP-type C4-dicarboxylate transport system substrate-binding protein